MVLLFLVPALLVTVAFWFGVTHVTLRLIARGIDAWYDRQDARVRDRHARELEVWLADYAETTSPPLSRNRRGID